MHLPHQHKWIVFSTCLSTVELMVRCKTCQAFGTVPKPTKEEWSAAFTAPDHPYPWEDHSRVIVRREPNHLFN